MSLRATVPACDEFCPVCGQPPETDDGGVYCEHSLDSYPIAEANRPDNSWTELTVQPRDPDDPTTEWLSADRDWAVPREEIR